MGEYVLFAGRPVREKGSDMLIEACRKAGLPLQLACKQESHPAILPTDKDIMCVMNKDRAELDEIYRRARIVAMPSLWYETFGLVAAEASALGLPVAASDIGALRHTVDHEKTGLLLPPGDVDAWAEGLTRLWNDPDKLRSYGRAARDKMKTDFNEDLAFDRLVASYRKVLA